MRDVVRDVAAFEPSVREPQKYAGGYCYSTENAEALAASPAYQTLEDHFTSEAFYTEMVDTLGPFAEGRLNIDKAGIMELARDPEHRYAALKLSGTGPDYVIRDEHVDAPATIMTYLFYIRLPDDFSSGGSLNILSVDDTPWNWKKKIRHKLTGMHYKLAKTVEYKTNTLVAFLNTEMSYHSVSVRRNNIVSRIALQGGITGTRDYF